MSTFIRKYRAEVTAVSIVALFWAGVWGYDQYQISATTQSTSSLHDQVNEEAPVAPAATPAP